jgi:hypothetical protein
LTIQLIERGADPISAIPATGPLIGKLSATLVTEHLVLGGVHGFSLFKAALKSMQLFQSIG